jgi:hypothetical protein
MYIITFQAINNDTYENAPFVLERKLDPDSDESERVVTFETLPLNIKEEVEFTYDGVWLPQLDTIQVFKVEEVKEWPRKVDSYDKS